MGWYDIAQVCINGHVVNSSTNERPQHNKEYCEKCGSKTIIKCQQCGTQIQGEYHVEGVFGISHYQAPSFCIKCGKPFPWTEAKIVAAQELANEMDGLSEKEREILSKSIDDIVNENPRTILATTRVKKLLPKIGKQFGEAFRDILVDIASETAKKALWPGN